MIVFRDFATDFLNNPEKHLTIEHPLIDLPDIPPRTYFQIPRARNKALEAEINKIWERIGKPKILFTKEFLNMDGCMGRTVYDRYGELETTVALLEPYRFKEMNEFYETILHEFVHVVDMARVKRMAPQAIDEMVALIGGSHLRAHFGLGPSKVAKKLFGDLVHQLGVPPQDVKDEIITRAEKAINALIGS